MKKVLIALSVAALFAGCIKNEENTITCTYDECAAKAPAGEIQVVKDYLATNNITAVEHCSGLFYAIDSVGTGATPTVCSGVAVRYKGMLSNGKVFDSSNTTTDVFPVREFIRGWINGLPKIKTGGGMRLYIPPSLGYGAQNKLDRAGNVVIPANSMLIFELKLDRVFQ